MSFVRLPILETRYKPIDGFPGYVIGSDGSVWSFWKMRGGRGPDRGSRVIGDNPHLLTGTIGGSYKHLYVNVRLNGTGRKIAIHILVLETFVGPKPDGMVSRHGPAGKYCNRVENLSWGTQKQNIADKHRDGTRLYGITNPKSKLTPESVRLARRDYEHGDTIIAIAARYGVSQSAMSSALHRATWKEVI